MADSLLSEYEEVLRDYRLAFSRGGAYTAIFLLLSGIGLDYALYPNEQFRFAVARILFSVAIYLIVFCMKFPWGQRQIQALTFLWLLLPQVMIAWMISQTEGATSIYYAGLNLAVFASGIALPFSLAQNIGLGVLTYLFYILACSSHPETFHIRGPFVVNSLFLIFTAAASAVCTFYNEQARRMLFKLKAEVAQKNRQLEQINTSLAQIKGQMLQQEKMAALGTLAAGLLHEVNNPVNFCLMAVDLAMEEPIVESSRTLKECLLDAKEGMQRVQGIVSDLKIFAYRKPDEVPPVQPFLFENAFSAATRLTGHELRGISVLRDFPTDNLVEGDEAAVIGVLINLLSNSAIAIRDTRGNDATIQVSGTWKGDRLFITVKDNGPGIPTENLTRVFEPFFTTREIGQGLGLGLSISYSVIQRHGGTLVAESEFGAWTQMTFDLPRAR